MRRINSLVSAIAAFATGIALAAQAPREAVRGDPLPHGRADFPADHPLARFPNPDSYIERSTIAGIKREALEGSADAALWLSFHYIDSVNDVPEGIFWLRLAAEFGDCFARTDYPKMQEHAPGRGDVWQPVLRPEACDVRRAEDPPAR